MFFARTVFDHRGISVEANWSRGRFGVAPFNGPGWAACPQALRPYRVVVRQSTQAVVASDALVAGQLSSCRNTIR